MDQEKADGGGRRRRSRATSSSGSGASSTAAAAAAERKEMERRRRQDMKGLCVKLASLIPKEHCSMSKMQAASRTQLGSLDEAAAYIKKLKERVDELHHKRSMMSITSSRCRSGGGGGPAAAAGQSTSGGGGGEEEEEDMTRTTAAAAVVEVRQHVQEGSLISLDVVLICSAARPVKFHDVITVLEEEGADIISANFSLAAHNFYYTIYSRAFSSRIGIEASRISERLRALVIRS
ncbi:transcription factor bHLH168 isoform X2 [Oryza sativa Japonica Group]|uniref:Os01g0108400 protein n=3 Tax=Oryza sativa TaxID=4530 RepID=Q0JRC6_ORYSJ|nr:transcription factor bHLH167 isoform X2 [Oryza sativa Japonica Group]BAF03702.2 Os01g0108400 [Oryza sativa Japonica Group]|eukprot:NP_001041788.2 Os01g0108400 [Oryza sativa Japonica Group]